MPAEIHVTLNSTTPLSASRANASREGRRRQPSVCGQACKASKHPYVGEEVRRPDCVAIVGTELPHRSVGASEENGAIGTDNGRLVVVVVIGLQRPRRCCQRAGARITWARTRPRARCSLGSPGAS
eukprot:4695540-Prymnesium_polylepis.1